MNKKPKIFNYQYFIFLSSIIYSVIFHIISFFSFLKKKNSINVNKKIFEQYTRNNLAKWKQKQSNKKDKILITSFVHHPGYIITESIIGRHVSNFYNFEPYGLINFNDEFGKKIIKSFNINNFVTHPKISLTQRIKYLFGAFIIIKKINNIDNFISYTEKNINYGRCIYDHILRNTTGGTLENINIKIYFFLAEALFYSNFYKNLFINEKFKYIVMSETQFLPSNIIFQNALNNNIKVLSRVGGTKKMSVRLFKSIKEAFQSNKKISDLQLTNVIKKSKKEYFNEGFKIINQLYEGEREHHDQKSKKNYINNNQNKKTSEQLLNHFGWDGSRKICTIYSHNLYDGNYNNEWRIFRDNLTWLRKTLAFIKNEKLEINWIIKDHPSDYGKNRNKSTTTFDEFQKIIGNNKNIKFFPKEFKTNLLREVTHCLFTSQGSAGLEYPCFGIPSIICGDAYYQGLSFTYEPKNELEYYNLIKNIDKVILDGLTKDQIKKAQSAFYFFEEHIKVENPLLFNFDINRNLDLNSFFSTATNKISEYQPNKDTFNASLKEQLETNNRHLINYLI